MSKDNLIEIRNLTKIYSDRFGYKILLFEDLTFEAERNRLTTILAPQGAGKSSLMRMIAGIETEFEGEIKVNTNDKIVFIPSEPSSFPWLSVKENLLFAKPDAGEEELKRVIKKVGLEGYDDHIPHNASAGFRFRVSLGRALILRPAAIVLDEPFSRISNKSKADVYSMVRKIGTEESTVILATTNISEALLLSDAVHLMKRDPGSIIASFNVDFPGDRSPDIISADNFIELRTQIEETAKKIASQKLFNFSI